MRKAVAITAATVVALLSAPLALGMPIDGVTGLTYSAKAFCPPGTQVVYVTQDVRNSADRGLAGNVWALDNYRRVISVVQTGPFSYCAALSYVTGNFRTNTGRSPSGLRFVKSGITGTMGGSYRTSVFLGTWAPTAPTSGSIGTFDYGCDVSPDCPGLVDWTTLYFSSTIGFTANWWSWAYATSANGTWVQRPDITYGDVSG
jgi:hypothetical protein